MIRQQRIATRPAHAMDPIAKTAWYCCGARAADAASRRPICGDGFAQCFMHTEQAQAVWRHFRRLKGPNATNVARHRLIDDLLCERLASDPQLPVLLLGAGLDTRAYRLPGGTWLEVDQPSLIEHKNECLPANQAANPLRRVAIDFEHEPLAQRLAPALADPAWRDHRGTPVVVLEGVSMYLDATTLGKTLALLRQLLPRHTLIVDLLDRRFERRYGAAMHRAIRKLGGAMAPALADPAGFVSSLGYHQVQTLSIAERAVAHGALPIPRWLFDICFKSLRDGYRVVVFEVGD
jgi:methyltransferase (TIGR00027 family)